MVRPPVRREASIAYDSAKDCMILFGGNSGALRSDVWKLPLGGIPNWSTVTPVGTGPTPRFGHSSVFDPASGTVIVFGGGVDLGTLHSNQSWRLQPDGAAFWRLMAPAIARRNHSAVLDPVARKILVFGGEGALGGRSRISRARPGESHLADTDDRLGFLGRRIATRTAPSGTRRAIACWSSAASRTCS